ncbi:hypothetical protein DAEQUDRAFT_88908 [Daedalea quercina L-15889]|uniref:Uncharacterized protein n=1 Tax=Daedalea quercina L-15889 TaxID=1314783 RepID=A0A165KY61_9APHY|nr:hypothetical protein DAEQUDRAFT_88908 [Daedalea quercina L-15889]
MGPSLSPTRPSQATRATSPSTRLNHYPANSGCRATRCFLLLSAAAGCAIVLSQSMCQIRVQQAGALPRNVMF